MRKEGRKEGWNLSSLSYENGPRRDGLVVGGDGDDSHRDDAGNFSDFLSLISLLRRQSVWGGIAMRGGLIVTATLAAMLQAFFTLYCLVKNTLPKKVFFRFFKVQILFFFQKFVGFWSDKYLKIHKFLL